MLQPYMVTASLCCSNAWRAVMLQAFKYVGRGVVSGVAAGTLGVGGSMFMMPQAQVMGMLPDVSAATVSAMTLATSAVSETL